MYLPIPSQPDCAAAWLAATKRVYAEPSHEACNVIIDVAAPVVAMPETTRIVNRVNEFLGEYAKPLMTVSNTIFPQGLYERHGPERLYDTFHNTLLPKIRKNCRWTGYYFDRITRYECRDGTMINPLQDVIDRLRDPSNPTRNKFEIKVFDPELDVGVFDPERDLDNSPYGGQCLSHLSFKLARGKKDKLILTAFYRNHYYAAKLLGNLIGLAQLLTFTASQAGVTPGSITIVSSHAVVEQPKGAKAVDVKTLLHDCENLSQ